MTNNEAELFKSPVDIALAISRIEGHQKGATEGLLKRLEAIEAHLEELTKQQQRKPK